MTGLHIVSKKTRTGTRWHVYAWRGGPSVLVADGAKPVIGPELLAKALALRDGRQGRHTGTLEEIISGYRDAPEFGLLAPTTQRDYRMWLDRISERFGEAALAAFEDRRMRRVIIQWRDGWAAQPRSADAASGMMGTLLGWAMENGLLTINVAAKIKKLHSVNKADQIWEDRHWSAVEDHWATFPNRTDHIMDALRLARLTGLRLGDLVDLDWSHVGEKAIIFITSKRKGRAVIPILPELREHLDKREHREGTILRSTAGAAWTTDGLKTGWQRAKPKGFDRTFHDLRGSYVTWVAMKGLTDQEIARIVGWTAKRVAEIRARYVDEARVIVSLVERLSA